MPMTKEEKARLEVLIDQIANNLIGDHIKIKTTERLGESILEFSLKDDDGLEVFKMQECNCSTFLRLTKDYRSNIETNLTKFILQTVPLIQKINLICVGGDWVGLSVILAKLYKAGYRTFSIANLYYEKDSGVLWEQKTSYVNFWKLLFFEAKINFHELFYKKESIYGLGGLYEQSTGAIKELLKTENYFVFAEDVGGSLIDNDTAIKRFIQEFVNKKIKILPSVEIPASQRIFYINSAAKIYSVQIVATVDNKVVVTFNEKENLLTNLLYTGAVSIEQQLPKLTLLDDDNDKTVQTAITESFEPPAKKARLTANTMY